MSKIGIIDYGMGNLGSVSNACNFLGLDAEIITAPSQLDACHAMILPGVGAFGDCMAHLVEHNFVDAIRDWVAAGKPFMGICLGLQALFQRSEESPGVEGLGVFEGTVKRFRALNDSNAATHPGLRPPLQRRGAFKIPSTGGVPERRGGSLDLSRNDISIVKCSSGADISVCPAREQTAPKLRGAPQLKVPQIGWNAVKQKRPDCPMFSGIDNNAYFYFVHSFYVAPEDESIVAGETDYGLKYCSAVWRDNVFAAQFHPEKSQATGLQMLRNFGKYI